MRKERLIKGILVLFFVIMINGLFLFLAVNSNATALDNLTMRYSWGDCRLQIVNDLGEIFADFPARSEYSDAGSFTPCSIMLIKARNFGAGYPSDALIFFGQQGQTLVAFYLALGDGEKVANWFVNKVSDKTEVGVRDLKVILQ